LVSDERNWQGGTPTTGDAGESQVREEHAGEKASFEEDTQPRLEEQMVTEVRPSGGHDGGQTYTVEQGDTLSSIAEHFYGDANAYMKIWEANRDKLDNPDVIQPGQELFIPG
jgi:nucleoid-associated protein YgaU